VPEARAAAPRTVASLAIIGGGTMGAGIAVAALDAGLPVVMVERDADSIARGRGQRDQGLRRPGGQGPHDRGAEGRHVMARFKPAAPTTPTWQTPTW
jgi:3-hydroxyacyl-CoA dehydrogenase